MSTGDGDGNGNDDAGLAADGLLPTPDKAVPVEIEGPKRPADPLAVRAVALAPRPPI